jgi:serine-type D-Ala-D-Ala carboxypeptidase (penicillin-binding protein 5/6)
MRVVHPSVYLKQQERRKKGKKGKYIFLLLLTIFSSIYVYLAANVRPQYVVARTYPQIIAAEDVAVSWPASGASAIGYLGAETEILASKNGDTVVPTASTIKILTAVVVLQQKPLGAQEDGERIYFNNADVEMTNRIISEGGAYFPVTNGMSMSYHQALELMLVGSANNISEKLAVWAFGGVEEFINASNIYLKANGMLSTQVRDPSGLLPTTTSTANDLLKIARKAMELPVFRQITNLDKTQVNGITVTSTNRSLATYREINGVKTGYTPDAGACLILSRTKTLNSKDYTFITVMLGQPDRSAVFSDSERLLNELESATTDQLIVETNVRVADMKAPWGEETAVITKNELQGFRWTGETVSASINVSDSEFAKRGTNVGKVSFRDREVNAVLADDLPSPSTWWRLTHALDYLREIL